MRQLLTAYVDMDEPSKAWVIKGFNRKSAVVDDDDDVCLHIANVTQWFRHPWKGSNSCNSKNSARIAHYFDMLEQLEILEPWERTQFVLLA